MICVGISRARARKTKWSEAHVGEINKQPCLLRLCSLAAEREHESEAGETKRILGARPRALAFALLQRYATAGFQWAVQLRHSHSRPLIVASDRATRPLKRRPSIVVYIAAGVQIPYVAPVIVGYCGRTSGIWSGSLSELGRSRPLRGPWLQFCSRERERSQMTGFAFPFRYYCCLLPFGPFRTPIAFSVFPLRRDSILSRGKKI